MAKRKRAPAFRVYGTADYFRDRDRLFTHGQYTIDRKVKTKAEALDMAYGFMLNNQPRGPNAYVLVEKTTSRGRDQIGSWNGDNWGEMAEATMRRNSEPESQTYIVEYTRTDSDDYTSRGWGIFTSEANRYESAEGQLLLAIKERFIEEVFSEEALEKGDTPERSDGAIYHLWTDYEAYSQDELDEMEEAGEEPESSTELVAIQKLTPADDDDQIAAYEEKHGEPDFEYDATE